MSASVIDPIIEVGIDQSDQLFVRPSRHDYELIYRAAADVRWDNDEKYLHGRKPREWTYADWYSHIVTLVRSEMGRCLKVQDSTVWTNMTSELEAQIQNLHRTLDL